MIPCRNSEQPYIRHWHPIGSEKRNRLRPRRYYYRYQSNNMKACPIGADSACCKHCFMGPCRLNAKDPYGKVGVCGATIDTIMARNFARMSLPAVPRTPTTA
jgi:hypothetical protein